MARVLFRILLRWLPAVIVIAAFVVYVWPTLYRYDHISFDNSVYPVRMNRFNGNSDMLIPDEGWVPVEGEEGSDQQQNVGWRGTRHLGVRAVAAHGVARVRAGR